MNLKFKDIMNNDLFESSVSRVWSHVENKNSSFGVISANRSELSNSENKDKHTELKKEVRNLGLGFIELKGGFVETLSDGSKMEVEEDSLLIPNITKNQILKLGTDYNQDSVLFKNKLEFFELGSSIRTGIGKQLSNFKANSNADNLTFKKDLITKFFSKLAKGNHKNKKFLFTLKESLDLKSFSQRKQYIKIF